MVLLRFLAITFLITIQNSWCVADTQQISNDFIAEEIIAYGSKERRISTRLKGPFSRNEIFAKGDEALPHKSDSAVMWWVIDTPDDSRRAVDVRLICSVRSVTVRGQIRSSSAKADFNFDLNIRRIHDEAIGKAEKSSFQESKSCRIIDDLNQDNHVIVECVQEILIPNFDLYNDHGVYECEGHLSVPGESGQVETTHYRQKLFIYVEQDKAGATEIPWTVLYVVMGVVIVVLTVATICRFSGYQFQWERAPTTTVLQNENGHHVKSVRVDFHKNIKTDSTSVLHNESMPVHSSSVHHSRSGSLQTSSNFNKPDVEGMVKLLSKLERASSELHSDEESDVKHQDTITDMACLQVDTLVQHCSNKQQNSSPLPSPTIVINHKQTTRRKSSLGLFASGISIGSGLIVEDFDTRQSSGIERRVTCPAGSNEHYSFPTETKLFPSYMQTDENDMNKLNARCDLFTSLIIPEENHERSRESMMTRSPLKGFETKGGQCNARTDTDIDEFSSF